MKIKLSFLLAVAFLVFAILSYANVGENMDNMAQDWLYQGKGRVDSRIVIIAADEPSLEKLGRWPWPRSTHAELLEKLAQGKPAAVGIDILFSEPDPQPAEDLALAQALDKTENTVLPAVGYFSGTVRTGSKLQPADLKEAVPLLKAQALSGHVNTFPDPDSVVRKTVLFYDYQEETIPSFAWKIANAYLQTRGQAYSPDLVPTDPWNRIHINYQGRPGDYERFSFYQVLNGEIPPAYFEDKIVLVGPYAVGLHDSYPTPLDHQTAMFGVEIHANIIQNLLYRDFKQQAPYWSILAVLLLFTGVSIWALRKLSPGRAVFVAAALILGYGATARLLYQKGWLLSLLYPVGLAVACYLLGLFYHYLEELLERKRVTAVFGRYVAPQVVKEILTSGEAGLKLGGVRREITVLFADIRGFTPFSEKAEPEEVVEVLNEYLDLCARAIFAYGGTLDKFIGDAAMALFNAPLDLPDHALKAAQAAWVMQEGSAQMKERLLAKYGRTVDFGVGINTGEAIVGNIGAQFRMDYTAIGDTVNTAARLESNAKPGQILLSQSTYERVKEQVKVSGLGEITVKGKSQRLAVYQLEGILPED